MKILFGFSCIIDSSKKHQIVMDVKKIMSKVAMKLKSRIYL